MKRRGNLAIEALADRRDRQRHGQPASHRNAQEIDDLGQFLQNRVVTLAHCLPLRSYRLDPTDERDDQGETDINRGGRQSSENRSAYSTVEVDGSRSSQDVHPHSTAKSLGRSSPPMTESTTGD